MAQRWCGTGGGLTYAVKGSVMQLKCPTSIASRETIAVYSLPLAAGCVVGVHIDSTPSDGTSDIAILTAAGWLFRVRARADAVRKRKTDDPTTTTTRTHDDGDGGVAASTQQPRVGPSPTPGSLQHLREEDAVYVHPPHKALRLRRETTAIAAVSTTHVLVVTAFHSGPPPCERRDAGAVARQWMGMFLPPPSGRDASPMPLDVLDGACAHTAPHISVVCHTADAAGAAATAAPTTGELHCGVQLESALYNQLFGVVAAPAMCIVALPTGRVLALPAPSLRDGGGSHGARVVHLIDEPVCAVLALVGRGVAGEGGAEGAAAPTADGSSTRARAMVVFARSGRIQIIRAGPTGSLSLVERRIEGTVRAAMSIADGRVLVFLADDRVAVVAEALADAPGRATRGGLSANPPVADTVPIGPRDVAWVGAVSPSTIALGLRYSTDAVVVRDVADLLALSDSTGGQPKHVDALRRSLVTSAAAERGVQRDRGTVERAIADVNVAVHLQRGDGGDGFVRPTCRIAAVPITPALRPRHTPAIMVSIRDLPTAVFRSARWSLVIVTASARLQRAPTSTRSIPLSAGCATDGVVDAEIPLDAALLPATVKVLLLCNLTDCHELAVGRPPGGSAARGSADDVVTSVLTLKRFDCLDFLLNRRAPTPYDTAPIPSEAPGCLARLINGRGSSPNSASSVGGTGAFDGPLGHRANIAVPEQVVKMLCRSGDVRLLEILAAFVDCAPLTVSPGDEHAVAVSARNLDGVVLDVRAVRRLGEGDQPDAIVLSISAGTASVSNDVCAAITDRMAAFALGDALHDGRDRATGGTQAADAGGVAIPQDHLDRMRALEQHVTHKYSTEGRLLQPDLEQRWLKRNRSVVDHVATAAAETTSESFAVALQKLYHELRGATSRTNGE